MALQGRPPEASAACVGIDQRGRRAAMGESTAERRTGPLALATGWWPGSGLANQGRPNRCERGEQGLGETPSGGARV